MDTKLEKIVVPVDGSDAALRAVRFANYLASLSDATLTLMHVQDNSALELLRVGNRYTRANADVPKLSDEQFEDIARKFVADPNGTYLSCFGCPYFRMSSRACGLGFINLG